MKGKTRKLISTLLTLAMVFSLITVMPLTASAGTGTQTIYISFLDTEDDDNSVIPAQSQYTYNGTSKLLTLTEPDGNYVLQGTNANLRIQIASTATGATIILSNVAITYPASNAAFDIYADCTLTLENANNVTAANHNAFLVRNGVSCIINGSGSLTAKAEGSGAVSGFNLYSSASLDIAGSGAITATSASVQGIQKDATAAITLSGSGVVTVEGGAGYAAISGTAGIKMGDDAKLTMTNHTSSNHTFERLNPASVGHWKVTGATTTSGGADEATVTISIANGATATVERTNTGPATIDVSTLTSAKDNNDKAGESRWDYNDSNKQLILRSASGNYTLTGTNTELRVSMSTSSAGADVTLDNAVITSTGTNIAFRSDGPCIMTLVGTNSLTASGTGGSGVIADNDLTITGAAGGKLTTSSAGSDGLSCAGGNLSIEGDATVTITSTAAGSAAGLRLGNTGGCTVYVAAGATLDVTGVNSGLVCSGTGTLNIEGSAKFTATAASSGRGMNVSALNIAGAGTVSAKGSDIGIFVSTGPIGLSGCDVTSEGTNGTAIAIVSTNSINMSDAATLAMANGAGYNEDHGFTSTTGGSSLVWNLTGDATLYSGQSDDVSVTVRMPANSAGTVARGVYVPPTAVTWSGLTANGTSGSVTTTMLTLTFDVDPATLKASDITVTGATIGALTGIGTERTLAISGISVSDGATVTVAITNPAGYTISPSSRNVTVYVSSTTTLVPAAAITGVTSPVSGATPLTAISSGTGFTASLSWLGNPSVFDYGTVYGARITLTATSGYTFSDYLDTASIAGFTVNGVTPVWVQNTESYLLFDVTFPATASVALVTAAPITGVTSPVAGATPSTAITNGSGFTASLSWDYSPTTFDYGTTYTAIITLTAASGYTFSGGFANTSQIAGFTVNGIAPTTWDANNGTTLAFYVEFPATAPPTLVTAAAITGVTSPVAGATPSTDIDDGTGFTAYLDWVGNPTTFDYGTAYTAYIVLTAESGYTFSGGLGNLASIAGFTINGNAPTVFDSNNGTQLVFRVEFPATDPLVLTLVTAAAITGVTSPVAGATPSTAINNGTGFTASLSWDYSPTAFDYGTAYTAFVNLTAASGYTFSGGYTNASEIAGFTVNGIAPTTWAYNYGTELAFRVTFPATAHSFVSATADGLSNTATSTKIELVFSPAITGLTAGDITITSGTGAATKGALTGSGTNWSIAISGVSQGTVNVAVTAPAGNSIVGSPKTVNVYAATPINIAAIGGIAVPAAGATPVTTITETAQYTGTVTWSTSPETFGYGTTYTATITLTPKTGFTLTGVTANFFTITGATTVTNSANSGVITAVFPATEHSYTISVEADTPAPPYTPIASGGTHTFTSAITGYGFSAIPLQYFYVLNTGTGAMTNLSAALSGTNASDFTLNAGPLNPTLPSGGGGGIEIRPNTELTAGTYTAMVTITDDNITDYTFTVSFTVSDTATYTIDVTNPATASGETYTFTSAAAGYAAITPTSFTIKNTGTGAMDNLDVALSSTTNFTLVKSSLNATLASGGTTSFTINPNTGLTAGTYTATVTITDDNITDYTFTVSFTVSAAPTIAVTSTGLTGLKVGQAISSASITYTLSGGTYAASINASDFAVIGLPAGLTAGTAVRTNGTVVTVPITGTPTTANTSTAAVTLPTSIPAANVTGAGSPVAVSGGPINASAVALGDGAAVSGIPTVSGTPTQTSITVNAVTNAGTTGQSVEYAISTTSGTPPASGWQSSTTFGSLTAGTTYYVYARTAADTNYNAGTAQQSVGITTATAPVTIPVTAITVTGAGGATTITTNGGTLQMSAAVTPGTATDQTVTWSVTNGTGSATINASGLLRATGNGTVTVTATANDGSGVTGTLAITISGQGGGGYTGGGSAPATTVPAGDGTVSVTYTNSGGVATLTMPESKVTEIIGKAEDEKATIDLSKVTNATGATMPTAALEQLAGAELAVEVKLPQGTVALNAAAAASIAAQANGTNVTISLNAVPQSTLTAEQRAAVSPGDLVFNISVTSGTQVITNFNGTITVTVPYTGSLPVAVWYLNAAGELEKLVSTYDPATKTVTFTTNHLSLYVVRLDNDPTPITPTMPVNPFSDVFGTDWFIDDVIYAYSKGLIAGTTPTTFSPKSNLKYSEAVTLAARMHQLYTAGEVTLENGDDPWYQPYVDYAVENGIIGAEDDYDWNATATRAGYMQIFASALPDEAYAAINSVPDGSIPDVPMDYPGAAAIYKLYRAGILQGNDAAHSCLPNSNIRRSEVAAILSRMMNPDARIEFGI